jgi:hypothetical protein
MARWPDHFSRAVNSVGEDVSYGGVYQVNMMGGAIQRAE